MFSFENLRVYVTARLQTACDMNYIKTEQLDELRPLFTDVAKMLSGLKNSLQKKIDEEKNSKRYKQRTLNVNH